MGGLFSKNETPKQVSTVISKEENEKIIEELKAPPTTPILAPKAAGNPFVLLFDEKDPRSPSVSFVRTPVIAANHTQSLNDINEEGIHCNAGAKSLGLVEDPRSPTVEFPRTPIIVPSTSKNDNENILSTCDPRSPTTEFTRTPIVVEEKQQGKCINKILDKVRKLDIESEIPTTPVLMRNTDKNSTDKKKVHLPKLLESSPIALVNVNNKRKSFVGLLETNIDYTETNLDEVINSKIDLNKTLPSRVNETILSPVSNKIKKQMDRLKEGTVETGDVIETSTFVLVKEDSESQEEINPIFNIEQPIIIKEEEVEEAMIKPLENEIVNVTAEVNNFEKKVTKLIFEDEEIEHNNVEIKKTDAKSKDGFRTPLAIRNGDGNIKKKISKLKVNEKPTTKSNSKIPVLKNSKKTQCENTAPNLLNRNNGRRCQWDADKSLLI